MEDVVIRSVLWASTCVSTDEVLVEVGQNLGRVATSEAGRTRDIQAMNLLHLANMGNPTGYWITMRKKTKPMVQYKYMA